LEQVGDGAVHLLQKAGHVGVAGEVVVMRRAVRLKV
jgi:hypothetical protein